MSYRDAMMEEAAIFHAHEMATEDTPQEIAFSAYCRKIEKLLGIESLDGTESLDGYSIDSASEAHDANITPEDYVKGERVEGWASDIQQARAARR